MTTGAPPHRCRTRSPRPRAPRRAGTARPAARHLAVVVAVLAIGAASPSRAQLAHTIERTPQEIRLRVTNPDQRPASCRFQLQLVPRSGSSRPVDVDVMLEIPAQEVDLVAWRVTGDVQAYRIVEGWRLLCRARR